MKLSFSTRGWDVFDWEATVSLADDLRFQGLEVYDALRQPQLTGTDGPLGKYAAARTHRDLRARKLSIPCLDSSCDLSSDSPQAIEELEALTTLAANLHCRFVSAQAQQNNADAIRANISKVLPAAAQAGVVLLVKTSGAYSDTSLLRSLMNDFASDSLAVLWDIHVPYSEHGESPATTIENLGAYIKHVHVRDIDADGRYNLVGEGTLPMEDIMCALRSIDYGGFLSLEWSPEWIEGLDDTEMALSHYVTLMERYTVGLEKKSRLIPNHDGTGYYIWPKDELIYTTFPRILDRMVEEFPDQLCFKYTTLDYTRTYAAFRKDVDTLARALVSLGVGRSSKVAVWATNVPAWYITFWATVKLGAVLVTVNTAYKSHEAEYLLRQSDTHTLVMIKGVPDSDYDSIISGLCPETEHSEPGQPLHCRKLPFLRNIITVGFRKKGCLTFEETMDRARLVPPETVAAISSEVRPGDVCNMQYTSGTTGFPKGVMLTHHNVVNNGKCIGDRMGLSTADRMMIQVPMFHCFGMVLSMTAAMTHGATMCPMPYFSAKSSLACINQERITCFNGVPTMFIAMFTHPDYPKTDFSHMRTGIMAGAGCPPELMRRAAKEDEMHMTGIVSVYGQTESAPGNTMSAWTDPLDLRCDTVGYAFPHVECKVINPETGEEAAPGENGEFCSRGYNTMKGYYKMPQATAQAIDSDGWLHSGDLACKAPDGTYRITGRIKDMIIRGGENIYPKEIEEFIYTHPKVRDVQVIGVPDSKYGEEAMACIILKEGESLSEQEMRDFIGAGIARHKVPRYIEFVDSFPMNAAGKVLKYKMREEAVKKYGLK